MCLDCNELGYREIQLQEGILRDYCECDVGQDLKEIVASEDFDYFDSVEGTVASIDFTSARKFVAIWVSILIAIVILATFL